MAWTVTLESVTRAGDPLLFDLSVSYRNSADPDWHVSKTLRVTIDPALTAPQQRAAVVAMITADAVTYQKQAAIHNGLLSIVGQSIVLSP